MPANERSGETPPTVAARHKGRVVAKHWRVNVLVVDDDAADRTLIVDVLWGDPNVGEVRAVDDPEAILFELVSGKYLPGVILLDINMPRVNGFKFFEALREIPAMRDTPVVFLTTSRFARDVEQARAQGAASYLVKPDSFTELKTRLSALIEQALTGAWTP